MRSRFLLLLLALAPLAPADVRLTRLADRVRVEIEGRLFTEYIYADGASRPYCYPILLADGTGLSRDFPMKETPGEDRDHPHHRALIDEAKIGILAGSLLSAVLGYCVLRLAARRA